MGVGVGEREERKKLPLELIPKRRKVEGNRADAQKKGGNEREALGSPRCATLEKADNRPIV